jgi:uncharacterized protein (DUF885 family)
VSEIAGLLAELIESDLRSQPVLASSMGWTAHDSELDDLSAEAFGRRDADASAFLARFEAIETADLTPDERIDRDLVIGMLRGRLIFASFEGWHRDPLVYSGPAVNGIFTLFLHRLRPEAELVEAAVARLRQVPAAVDQGRANLDPSLAHPLIVGRGIASARGGARYLRDLLADEVAHPRARAALRESGAGAADALEAWASHLEGVAVRATGTWLFGEERYSRVLREREALPHDARGLREIGRAEFDRLDAEMRSLASDMAGTDDWSAVLRRANADHPASEEAMREAYESWTARARAFLARTGLVTLPDGETCRVVPSPVFMRPVLGVAFYISPPAFAERLTGHFFVPFAPDGTPPDEVQARLGSNSHGSLPSTSVHEAYPGHHWHLVMRRVHASPIRRLLSTPYFSEGWALYSERLMRERGFFEQPIAELYHLEATIFRAARIVIDTSLHLGEMSVEEAVGFLTSRLAMPEPTARAEVARYCAWPTQAASYLTGCLEILRLRERWLAARGFDASRPAEVPAEAMRGFHDRLAMSGALPLGLAARVMLEDPAAPAPR